MPRRYPDNGTVEFTAKIPEPLYNEFIGFFPQHGANSWFIKTALITLLEQVRNDPQAVSRIRDAVSSTIRTA